MDLTPDQRLRLHEALLGAFPNVASLRRMMTHRLGENLDQIVASGDLEDCVFQLLDWAQSRGNLRKLTHAARLENPGNEQLATIAAELFPDGTGNDKAAIAEREWEVLREYATTLERSRHMRLSTGGLMAEAPTAADRIREPSLEDIFVEPLLAPGGSLRESRDEVETLLELTGDDDVDPAEREDARCRLLKLRSETWEKLWKAQAHLASTVIPAHSALVLLGDPGSGKSTLLWWIMLRRVREILAGTDGPVPLFVAVGDYAEAWTTAFKQGQRLLLRAYLVQRAESEQKGLGAVVDAALAEGRRGALLLLDGLDEVPRERRRAVVGCIQDFIQQQTGDSGSSRVLVTSRFFGYEEAPITDPAVQFVVAPFSDKQIREFASKWYAWLEKSLHPERNSQEIGATDSEAFQSVLFSQPQILDLARNPLMLTMIAVVAKTGRRLPQRRVELYDLTLKQLMTEWEYLRREAGARTDIDYGEACQLWAPIARWMHEVGTGAVHEDELKRRLRARIKELELEDTAEDWLTVRGDKACLLQERGARVFGFLHQTFQEYLAAMDLENDEGGFVPELPRYIEDPRWHEVIRLACGYLGVITRPARKAEVTHLLQRILDNGSRYEHLLHRDLLLAASCIADDVKPRPDMEREVVTRLISVATSKVMEPIAVAAMEALVTVHGVAVPPDVVERAAAEVRTSESWEVRYRLVQWLGTRTGSESDFGLRRLCRDFNSNVGSLAQAYLWVRNGGSGLLDRLPGSSTFIEKEVTSLLHTEPIQLINHLTPFNLLNLNWLESLLAQFGRSSSLRRMIVPLLSSEDSSIRLKVAEVLRETEHGEAAQAALLTLLEAEDPWFQHQAIELLRETKLKETAQLALVTLLGEKDTRIRWIAAELLGSTNLGEAAQAVLVTRLAAEDTGMRIRAARVLKATKYREAAHLALMPLLEAADSWVRLHASVLLHTTKLADIAETNLIMLLAADDTWLRLQAAEVLKETKHRETAYLALMPMLESEDSWMRLHVSKLLRGTKFAEAAETTLVALLSAEDVLLRRQAGTLLRETKIQGAARMALLTLLGTEDDQLLLDASGLLKETEHWEAAQAVLLKLLASEDTLIQLQAAKLLQETEHWETSQAMFVALLGAEHFSVRVGAVELLRGRELSNKNIAAMEHILRAGKDRYGWEEVIELFRRSPNLGIPSLLSLPPDAVNPRRRLVLALRDADGAALELPILAQALRELEPESLSSIQPDHLHYPVAWLYASLVTSLKH